MQPQASKAFAAFIGLDGAEAPHDVCLQAAGTAQRELLSLAQSPEESNAWGQTLRTRFHGPPGAVGLDRKKGPSVSALRHEDFLVLFPVHPLTVATSRDACTPSRAQDDPTEAALQGASLLTHRDTLTPRSPQSPTMRALAPLVEQRRRLGGDNVRLTPRLPRALQNSCPHVLWGLQDNDTALFGDVLSRWPTRKAAPRARRTTLARVFRAHHVRSADVRTTRIEAITSAGALPTDEGVITPNALLVPALVAQLRVPLQGIADCDNAMAQRAQEQPDFALFDAVPRAGAVCAPRLLVAVGAHRARDASAEARPKYAASAPVTDRSGKQSWGHWRLQCPTLRRQTFVAWAAASTRHAFWAQVDSQQQRAKGKAHQAAVRALAFQWIRILSRCWQDRTPYEASVYLQALNRCHAPLLHNLAH
jgi:Transposase/Transposase IS116/IS110/IS902 family